MTVTILNLANSLPMGVTLNFEPPCVGHVFSNEILTELFQEKLPTYVAKLKVAWEAIPNGQVSGFAPGFEKKIMDSCETKDGWDAERFVQHNGPVPIIDGALGSKGRNETWPYQRSRWIEISHGNWARSDGSEANAGKKGGDDEKQNLANMDWNPIRIFEVKSD